MTVDALVAALRAASFIAMLQAVGAVVFLRLWGPHLSEASASIRRVAQRSSVVALVFVGAQYAMEAGRMGGDLTAAGDLELQRLVLRSPLAVAASLRVLGLALIAWNLRRGAGPSLHAAVTGCGLTVAAFALVGHTPAYPDGLWLQVVLVLHVGAAAFWFGSLLPLLLVLKREPLATSSRIVDSFSSRAGWLVPGLFLAGAALLAALTRLSPQVLRLPYGQIMVFKVATFTALLGIALLNRLRLAPQLRLGRGAAVESLRASIALEVLLIAAVLAATAVLTTFYSPHD